MQDFIDTLSTEVTEILGLTIAPKTSFSWSYLVIPSLTTSFSSVNSRMPCGTKITISEIYWSE